jgi:hypothetical protein|nr:MAG TPA: hypothetical protein [Caudoviricetes sp.]
MNGVEIAKMVRDGAKFTINFQKRTCRVNGKVVNIEVRNNPKVTTEDVLETIEFLYEYYKRSVPSERSESHRRYYFKALPEKDLTDEDMMYGDNREVERFKLEFFVLGSIISGKLIWKEEWGSWFWQSPSDKDLIILRDWIEPNKGGE